MRGLALIVTRPDGLRAALELAAAHAALGGRTRLFVQGAAVVALALPLRAPDDAVQEAAGLPALAALFEEALALGVEPIACQTGLALAALTADRLDPRMAYAGPVSLLGDLGEDRLVVL